MTTQTMTYKPWLLNKPLVNVITTKVENFLYRIMPRPKMLVSGGILLLGLAVPVFMLVELLPASLLLGFAGLGLTAIGGVLSLVFIGDI